MKNKHIARFTENLERLSGVLGKCEKFAEGDASILQARLSKDMFPLCVQVEIAASFALRSCCPIAGMEVVSFAKPEKSFESLSTQLSQTIEHLKHLDERENNLSVTINDQAGPSAVSLVAEEFLERFALPNFYFHLSMVYAIARAQGVPLTKGDFDGLHTYPPGFSFEDE